MKLRFCVVCGTNKDLQHHHIIPKSKGGDDHPHNFLTLCWEHHNWIHDIRKTKSKGDFVACIKAGQINGVGGRPKLSQEIEDKVISLYNDKKSYRAIRRETGCGLSTIRRVVVEHNLSSRS